MLLKITGAVPHVGGVLAQPGDRYYEILRGWIAGGARYDADAPRVTRVEAYPGARTVPLPGQRQQVRVVATFNDGKSRDVTSEAFLESSNTEVATVDRQAIVTTLRRGEATLIPISFPDVVCSSKWARRLSDSSNMIMSYLRLNPS
ncbi:MAG: hypothetical protein ACKO26_22245, partial [Planctomycetota bacterium]